MIFDLPNIRLVVAELVEREAIVGRENMTQIASVIPCYIDWISTHKARLGLHHEPDPANPLAVRATWLGISRGSSIASEKVERQAVVGHLALAIQARSRAKHTAQARAAGGRNTIVHQQRQPSCRTATIAITGVLCVIAEKVERHPTAGGQYLAERRVCRQRNG